MIRLPLEYLEISDVSSPNIMLGKSPERDREIEGILRNNTGVCGGRHPGGAILSDHPGNSQHRWSGWPLVV